jgi:hypothetical protein
MNLQSFFHRLQLRLNAERVPADYSSRLIEELKSHAQAAIDRHLLGGMSSDAAEAAALQEIGSEAEIVRSTLDSLRRETFIGRNRILSLFIAPPLLLLAAMIGTTLLFTCIRYFRYPLNMPPAIFAKIQMPIANILLPLLFVAYLWRLGRRHFCGFGFTLSACILLAAVSLYVQIAAHPANAPRPAHWTPSANHVFLLVVYLALLALAVRRRRDLHQRLSIG